MCTFRNAPRGVLKDCVLVPFVTLNQYHHSTEETGLCSTSYVS